MLVLALDTTTRTGSLALVRDGHLLDQWSGDGGLTHATRLPGDVLQGLARHGLALTDIDLYGVAAGPGSFTGLRIGIATVQGLAFAHGRPVVGVSALDALAYAAWDGRSPLRVAAWMDAQRQEVFSCLYEAPTNGPEAPVAETAGELGELRIVAGPEVGSPSAVLERWAGLPGGPPRVWTGDGAVRYREVLDGTLVDPVPPLAAAIGTIAMRRAARGLATPPHGVRPVYIRRPDAELARDRRLREAAGAPREGR